MLFRELFLFILNDLDWLVGTFRLLGILEGGLCQRSVEGISCDINAVLSYWGGFLINILAYGGVVIRLGLL